jgi:hypothetical protein
VYDLHTIADDNEDSSDTDMSTVQDHDENSMGESQNGDGCDDEIEVGNGNAGTSEEEIQDENDGTDIQGTLLIFSLFGTITE